MATGGIFTLITNDGKQDRMLMATALLHKRLNEINQMRAAENPSNLPLDATENLPTLLDIERTHILFTNAHFKPFAAMGFEYNKVQTTSGNPSLGGTVVFSIPQFGDFFHDMCVHATLTQPTLSVTAGTEAQDSPAMRWCDFPGERLLEKVTQEVNGNPLDEYTFHATNMHREYRVAPNKIAGWKKCVGQEVSEKGFVSQPNWANNGVSADSHRVVAEVQVGNQTPSPQKTGNLEMFIPLLFWYNKDVRLAVPSVAIPYGQRFINLELASLADLCDAYPRGSGSWASPNGSVASSTLSIELYINNIFVNPEVHKIYIKRIGFSLIRVHRQQLYSATSSSAEVLLQQLKWPIEYLFVGMKVKDYWNSSTAATKRQHLDKWHKFSSVSSQTYNTTGQNVLKEDKLISYVDGTETLGIGQADFTTASRTSADLTGTGVLEAAVAVGDLIRVDGQLLTVLVGAAAGTAVTGVTVANAPTLAVAASTDIASAARKVTLQGMQYETQRCAPTMNNITIKAHGVSIHNNLPMGFFNSYTTYHYGGPNINTPEDCGLAFIPFCLYPGTYQPSGHINVSRAREFYIEWDSSVISSSTNGTLVVLASALNFLLISDGSAVLRYST